METEILKRLENLKKLSITELMNNCQDLRSKERRTEVALIAHLSELRNRSGFLDYGYNSIFAYCQKGLGLDDGPSYLRMQVSGICQKIPSSSRKTGSWRIVLEFRK